MAGHVTWLSPFMGLDALVSNTLTRELLDWRPTHPGLLDDLDDLDNLDKGHYFDTPATTA
ncbi:hypothetical protein ACIOGX_02080 [Streptomyces sp. NPDC088147]|uniref:hypothetical protein n=1 Tax=Streptomyces sp. NPDC088147 TaxID=3365830 RepID=UPI003827D72A